MNELRSAAAGTDELLRLLGLEVASLASGSPYGPQEEKLALELLREYGLDGVASDRCFFIVGSARSGTTIAFSTLNTLKHIYLLTEDNPFLHFDFTDFSYIEPSLSDFRSWYQSLHNEKNFARHKGYFVPDFEGPTPRAADCYGALQMRYRVVGSKYAFGPHGDRFQYLTFLRDPVDQVISNLYFHLSFDGFRHEYVDSALDLRSCISRGFSAQFFNLQTRILSGLAPLNPPAAFFPPKEQIAVTRAALHAACKNIQRDFFFVGLTEEFDRSLTLLSRILETEFDPDLVPPQKVTPTRPGVSDLCQDTLRAIREANRLDIDLYDFARRAFDGLCKRYNVT